MLSRLTRLFNGLRIVYYHSVNDVQTDFYFSSAISTKNFRRQLSYFSRKYEIISLGAAIEKSKNGEPLEGFLCITFDDGFSCCYANAYPILKEYKVPATFYLIESTINNCSLMWRNKLLVLEKQSSLNTIRDLAKEIHGNYKYLQGIDLNQGLLRISDNWGMEDKEELTEAFWRELSSTKIEEYLDIHKPYLTDAEIFEMMDNGMEFGNHTYSHPFCSNLSDEMVWDEIIHSNQRMSERFGIGFNSFSYPFGETLPSDVEKKIIENSSIEVVLGIKDSLQNQPNEISWNRVNMERPLIKAYTAFYLSSMARHLIS